MLTKQDAMDLLTLVNSAQISGASAERVVELKRKLSRIEHEERTGQRLPDDFEVQAIHK